MHGQCCNLLSSRKGERSNRYLGTVENYMTYYRTRLSKLHQRCLLIDEMCSSKPPEDSGSVETTGCTSRAKKRAYKQ